MVYPPIVRGASLLIALSLSSKTTFIVGTDNLAATRATSALQADSKVIIACERGTPILSEEIKTRKDQGELDVIEFEGPDHLQSIIDTLHNEGSTAAVAFITDTLIGSKQGRSFESAVLIRNVFKRRNILVNVSDMPSLCDFTLPACHRFTFSPLSSPSTSSSIPNGTSPPIPSSLQIAVTTNGRGCRLASRIRREIVSRLPSNIGNAVETIASLRELARARVTLTTQNGEDSQPSTPNSPVPQGTKDGFVGESEEERRERRMRWVAQISEYWPLENLATLDPASNDNFFRGDTVDPHQHQITTLTVSQEVPQTKSDSPPTSCEEGTVPTATAFSSRHGLDLTPQALPLPHARGKIYLLGSGTGHPGLLTVSAHDILTRKATLVLSDKLVPSEVLSLIPNTIKVKIAKKFPGNAEGAQNELMIEAVEAASRGETVVRLKQGDPAVFGRVGEEILYFRKHGFESIVIPGISSAIAGPSLAGIPITQRGVADSMVLCTGVGRQGKPTRLPGYIRSRTLVLLMGVARLESLLDTLVNEDEGRKGVGLREGEAYPPNLPIAIIERASMPDQRTIFGTLETIKDAMVYVGEQRPPGMIVVGWSVLALEGEGDVEVLEDATKVLGSNRVEEREKLRQRDDERVQRWLRGTRWSVREGFINWD